MGEVTDYVKLMSVGGVNKALAEECAQSATKSALIGQLEREVMQLVDYAKLVGSEGDMVHQAVIESARKTLAHVRKVRLNASRASEAKTHGVVQHCKGRRVMDETSRKNWESIKALAQSLRKFAGEDAHEDVKRKLDESEATADRHLAEVPCASGATEGRDGQ